MIELPDVSADIDLVADFFAKGGDDRPIRNPHHEPRVSKEVMARARDAAVLIALVTTADDPRIIVTRRNSNIRFAGHICFPGGTIDQDDNSAVEAALRETREEIGLLESRVEVLGNLGFYYTQTGYRITPVVGVADSGEGLVPNPSEVAEIRDISLSRALSAGSYELTSHGVERAHYAFHEADIRIGGPTVSILIGLYESLARFVGRN